MKNYLITESKLPDLMYWINSLNKHEPNHNNFMYGKSIVEILTDIGWRNINGFLYPKKKIKILTSAEYNGNDSFVSIIGEKKSFGIMHQSNSYKYVAEIIAENLLFFLYCFGFMHIIPAEYSSINWNIPLYSAYYRFDVNIGTIHHNNSNDVLMIIRRIFELSWHDTRVLKSAIEEKPLNNVHRRINKVTENYYSSSDTGYWDAL